MDKCKSIPTAPFEELWARLLPEAAAHLQQIARDFTEAPHRHESPIEHLFAVAWELSGRLTFNRDDGHFYELRAQQPARAGGRDYRVDFVVCCVERFPIQDDTRLVLRNVAIELDGHEFHERTKEQVAYRNARDRALQAEGWKVFHFSGSEVWRTPMKCVAEVEAYCESEMTRLYCLRREQGKAAV